MQVETVTASTMSEALREVKRRLGTEAVILSTRTTIARRWLGLRRRPVVEVTAGRGVNIPPRRPTPPPQPIAKSVTDSYAANAKPPAVAPIPASSPKSAAALSALSTPALPPGQGLIGSQAVQALMMNNVADEVGKLKGIVQELVTEVRHRTAPDVPDDLREHYCDLLKAEVSEELAADIVRKVQQHARPEQLANPQFVREKVLEQVEKLIPLGGAIERKKADGPHVVALIGPTGVGKTTTIAKLAANLALRQKRRVGLITIDTYRIAAIDQLRKYADLMGVRLEVANNPEQIAEAVAGMAGCEYVLIDTAGRSPNDELKLNELRRFLEHAGVDEVHLVLSTTCGPKSVELAIEKFGNVRVDKVIFTKVDEAAQLGILLSAMRKVNKGLSYLTTGQDVPDDIEVGAGRRVARLILGERA